MNDDLAMKAAREIRDLPTHEELRGRRELDAIADIIRRVVVEPITDKQNRGCPCTLTLPCGPQCTCAYPFLSGGCQRCCRYGSDKQRLLVAEWLVTLMEQGKANADRHPARE